jgi:hypothetical protein
MHLIPRPDSRIVARSIALPLLDWLTRVALLRTIVGVAAPLERFYKPELDAAHNRRLQAIRLSSRAIRAAVCRYLLPGILQ